MARKLSLFVGAVCALAISGPSLAAPAGVKVGILTCQVHSGWGYVVGSSKKLSCNYRPRRGGTDHYTGSLSKLGVDLGYTSGGTLVWDVIAPTSDLHRGDLTGDYAGATASATIGAGVGANVMLGGFDKSIALQPVSVFGNTGLDVSGGLGQMILRADNAPSATSHVG